MPFDPNKTFDVESTSNARDALAGGGFDPAQAYDEESPGVVKDMGRGAARGALSNLEDALSGSSYIGLAEGALSPEDLLSSADVKKVIEENFTGEIPEPQTLPGKMTRGASNFLTNPTSYIGGSAPANMLRAGVAGATSEAAGALGEKYGGEAGGTAGRVIGAISGGKVADTGRDIAKGLKGAKAAESTFKSIDGVPDYLEDSAQKIYQSRQLMNTRYKVEPLAQAKDQIKNELIQKNFNQIRAEKAHKWLEQLSPEALEKIAKNGEVSFGVVNDIKRSFYTDFARADETEKAAASMAASLIDRYMEAATPNATKALKMANDNWRAAQNIRTMQDAVEQAVRDAKVTGQGANIYNKLRQRANAMQKDPRITQFMDPEIKAGLQQIADGGSAGKLLNLIAKAGPDHPLSGWGSAFASDILSGTPGLAIGQLFAGSVAQKWAPQIVLQQYAELEAQVARSAGVKVKTPESLSERVARKAGANVKSVAPLVTGADDKKD